MPPDALIEQMRRLAGITDFAHATIAVLCRACAQCNRKLIVLGHHAGQLRDALDVQQPARTVHLCGEQAEVNR